MADAVSCPATATTGIQRGEPVAGLGVELEYGVEIHYLDARSGVQFLAGNCLVNFLRNAVSVRVSVGAGVAKEGTGSDVFLVGLLLGSLGLGGKLCLEGFEGAVCRDAKGLASVCGEVDDCI